MNSNEIQEIVNKTITKLAGVGELSPSCIAKWHEDSTSNFTNTPVNGTFNTVTEAVEAAKIAYNRLAELSLKKRGEIIDSIREHCLINVKHFAQIAHEETGLGRYEDKIKKNLLVINKTPGIEDIKPTAFSGDNGLTLVELAPYGVIGSITPVTNPTETIICNAIGMIAAANSVVFNPHPSAKKTCKLCIEILNQAIISAGGPANLITGIIEPTIKSAQELMQHPDIKLLVVTGGGAVVKAAMASGKKCIAAGPGNPPVVVDETANISKAARDIIAGASLDNNVICIAEKETIAVDSIADELINEMIKAGCYKLSTLNTEKLRKVLIPELYANNKNGIINKNFVGKTPAYILKEININVSEDIRLIITEVDKNHPFVWTEMLMPVMPIVRARNVDEAINIACEVEQGNFHTAIMHSKNIDKLSKMARLCNASIFVKNAPSYAGLGLGGEGFTSFTIASPTGEGLTSAKSFSRERRCTIADNFRIT